MSTTIPGYDAWRLASPPEDDDAILGTCYGCKADLGEIAYQHPTINESLCPSCAYRSALETLRNTPLDELDGIPSIERAVRCRDCGMYRTDCRCE